ncbi:hypothetical protein [Planktothrix pseudagardhii]|uniref:Uncharacterized protein n=1 Tax=Planktothrix pseudagardhii TaxID=132604 RepID=A0A9W4G3K2_9CYAN|nr:hypothetical protein [Planktothrix pseudagardhii]CAD5927361.1 hypothetical protein NO713_01061 [Planktothrix pseudagardhii]
MPNQLFKLLVGISICSALPLSLDFTNRAWADVPFPVAEVESSFAGKISVPLFLPESLPLDRDIYFTAKVTPTGYNIEMSATPNCRGVTACFIGSLVAERGGKRSEPTSGPRQEYQALTLTGGIEGSFSKGCGAYCTALVEWEYQGVLYRVFMKNGDLETLQEIANRAIASGPRSL